MDFPHHSSFANPTGSSLGLAWANHYAAVLAFLAVASEGSFARAAERLGIGRSAVSRSVQKLEKQLDTRLFIRTTRQTVMTDEGERFFAQCQPGFQRIAQAFDDLQDLRHGPPRGVLRLAVGSAFGRVVVSPLLGRFCALYPDITIEIRAGDGPVSFTAERVDVALVSGEIEANDWIARPLAHVPLRVCASPHYLNQYGEPRHPGELALHRCINLSDSAGQSRDWHFKRTAQVEKCIPPASLTVNDVNWQLQAVLEGQGMAQMPAFLVDEHLAAGRLQSCLQAFAPEKLAHYLCYPSRKHLPTRVSAFIDFIVASLGAHGASSQSSDMVDDDADCSARAITR